MATDAVYQYLKLQNRPFSVNDIVSNLHDEYAKPVVQKALEKLVSANKIFEKVYGKQRIYCVVQDANQDAIELIRIDRELKSHANEVEAKRLEVEREIREQEAKLNALRSTPSLDDALKMRNELRDTVRQLTKKLDDLMEASGPEDLGVEKRKAEKMMNDYSRDYNKRKRLCTEIIDCILEGYPGSKKDLHEEIGIEVKIVQ